MLQMVTDKQVLEIFDEMSETSGYFVCKQAKKREKKNPENVLQGLNNAAGNWQATISNALLFLSFFFSIVPLFLHSQLIGKTRKAEERCQGRREELQPRPDGVNQCLGLLTRACGAAGQGKTHKKIHFSSCVFIPRMFQMSFQRRYNLPLNGDSPGWGFEEFPRLRLS